MENYTIIALAVSALLNIALLFRGRISKGRTQEYGNIIVESQKRCKLAFELLWGVAEERGETDKSKFGQKMVMLTQVPEELVPVVAQQIELLPPVSNSNSRPIGFGG